MSSAVLHIRRRCGQEVEATAEVADAEPWSIRVKLPTEDGPRTYEGPDLFECLVALRREVERSGDQVVCAGARRDVYPSRMAREMGGGRLAYVLRAGQPAGRKDLVDIFAPAEAGLVGSVDEQRRNFEAWLEMLR
jgi:hypothetical protein